MRTRLILAIAICCSRWATADAAEATTWPVGRVVFERSAAEQRIYEVLNRRADWNFVNEPLDEILRAVATRLDIPIEVDQRALSDASRSAYRRVSLQCFQDDTQAALGRLLQSMKMV